jgi:hypothetical protein
MPSKATIYRNVTEGPDGLISGEYRDMAYSPDRWTPFSGTPELMRIRHVISLGGDAVYRSFYQLADGYGVKGYVPPQGLDWSGIRDSSDEAIAAMDAVSRKWHPMPFPWEEASARATAAHRDLARVTREEVVG